MEYIQEIILELNSNSAYPVVSAKQNDVDTRILRVHYTKDGTEYQIDQNNSVALRLRKPDMKLVFNDGVINADGTVDVTLTYQCLTTAGRAYADLVEFNSAGQMLSTISFIVNIQAAPDVMGTEAISSNEFLYLKSFIDRGNEVIGQAQEWAIGYNGDTPIPSSNPAYNNHSKYYSQLSAAAAASASEARQAIEDMTVSAFSAPIGEAASVSKTTVSGVVNLDFGIPQSEAIFVLFDLNYSDGILYMIRPDVSQLQDDFEFSVNEETGELEVTYSDN